MPAEADLDKVGIPSIFRYAKVIIALILHISESLTERAINQVPQLNTFLVGRPKTCPDTCQIAGSGGKGFVKLTVFG
jgi:hypothetical protein